MATNGSNIIVPHIVRNCSLGLEVVRGSQPHDVLAKLTQKCVRCFELTSDGTRLIWAEDDCLKVLDMKTLKLMKTMPVAKTNYLTISPLGTHLAAWFPFKSSPPGQPDEPNLWIMDLNNDFEVKGKLVCKHTALWSPEWTDDEFLCGRTVHSELQLFENHKYDRWVCKSNALKVQGFSVVRNVLDKKYYVSTFTPGVKGQPSFVKIFRHPKIDAAPLASKSFFRGDSVKFNWSPTGSTVLITCICDVDKSGKSYYGTQMLHHLDLRGNASSPQLNKDGPIHDAEWIPISKDKLKTVSSDKDNMYCVVYGYMPAKVGLFNLKSELMFDFGNESYSVNQISFNPFGNILVLAGFGNLRGGVYVWDVARLSLLANFKCPETTNLSWSSDGITIMTSTTSPRLRVGNGFKIWKYNGLCLYEMEHPTNTELYQIAFQPFPSGTFTEPVIRSSFKPVEKVQAAPKYVPPGQRDKATYLKQVEQLTKAAATKQNNPGQDVEKKIKNLEKKIKDIAKLKQEQSAGKVLEKNQLEKLTKEAELVEELNYLRIHS